MVKLTKPADSTGLLRLANKDGKLELEFWKREFLFELSANKELENENKPPVFLLLSTGNIPFFGPLLLNNAENGD